MALRDEMKPFASITVGGEAPPGKKEAPERTERPSVNMCRRSSKAPNGDVSMKVNQSLLQKHLRGKLMNIIEVDQAFYSLPMASQKAERQTFTD